MYETLNPLRRFYRSYLARYWWTRKLKQFVLRAWFGGRYFRRVVGCWLIHLLHRMGIKLGQEEPLFFTMTALKKYCISHNSKSYTLVSAETVTLVMPVVHPEHFRKHMHAGYWPMEIPSVMAIEIPDAEVMGKCDFIFNESRCLHHGLYRWERDLSAEEMHGMLHIDAKRKRIMRWVNRETPVIVLDKAISLINSASANYVHWLTEAAPKLALIDEIEELKSYPLIIDSGLHPNIIESLNCLNTHRREIVQLERGQLCKVGRLITITPVAYSPFDYRRTFSTELQGPDPGWAMFVPSAIHTLRQKLLFRTGSGVRAASLRLYLRRSSNIRPMRNAEEVENLLTREFGYKVIEPEKLSFAEQIELFSRAESIVAQAGAALGNMIFAPKGCRVVILSARSPYNIYYYFSNLASILGLKCCYVLCNPDSQEGDVHPAHKGLIVDIQTLREVVANE